MKVILCKSQFMGPISGADETIVTYATQLKKAGHDASVLMLYATSTDAQYRATLDEYGAKYSYLTNHPVHVILVSARSLARQLVRILGRSSPSLHKDAEQFTRRIANRYYEKCYQHIVRSGADVVHVLTPDAGTPVVIAASHAAGVPVIYQEVGTPYGSPAHAPYYQRLIEVLSCCTEVVALTPYLAEQCRVKYEPPCPVSVMPVIVEDLGVSSEMRRRVTTDKVIFGFAARFIPMKAPLDLLQAFAELRADFPDARLKMAGAGVQESEITRQASRLGVADDCSMPGFYINSKQKQAFLQSLDVFVHPSLSEGTPNSIVEAMSLGLPIIATTVGGIPEVVPADAGILVPPGDVAALKEAMHRLATDAELRTRMGQAARARYEEIFSPEAVLPVILETYGRVARTKHTFAVGATTQTADVTSTARDAASVATALNAADSHGDGRRAAHPWTQVIEAL